MQKIIFEKLNDIEKTEHVHILLAVESGSRAWGFASTDSDYDVRFIYVRPQWEYLRLEQRRDVIELPINEVLDINGWDLDKTLKLLHCSNPTLFEWFSSTIIYVDNGLRELVEPILARYFSSKKGLYHYLNMAKGNYRKYLCGNMVKAKKYFYVLRPILACKWIIDKGTNPPILFSDLVKAELEPYLRDEVARLLEIKMNEPEMKLIPRVDVINAYLDKSIGEIEAAIALLPKEPACDWEELNRLFLTIIEQDRFMSGK